MDILLTGFGGGAFALGLIRFATGAFFAISGYHKLFNIERKGYLRDTLKADGIPLIEFNVIFVPAVELIGGFMLAIGLLTVPVAIILAGLLSVALCTDGYKRVQEFSPLDWADKIDDYLFLSETVYILVLLIFVAAGPGILSLDYLLF